MRKKPAKVPPRNPGKDDALTDSAVKVARDLGQPRLANALVVAWNPRLRSTAGRAWPGKGLIELNPRLREIGGGEVERTLLHELAHLIAHERAGGRRISPHGPEWRQACAELGIPGESPRHRLPLPRATHARRFRYACPACGAELARVRPIRRTVACFACCKRHAGGRFDARFALIERH